jgi:hypothetical protein
MLGLVAHAYFVGASDGSWTRWLKLSPLIWILFTVSACGAYFLLSLPAAKWVFGAVALVAAIYFAGWAMVALQFHWSNSTILFSLVVFSLVSIWVAFNA